jgi:hypothetical protein
MISIAVAPQWLFRYVYIRTFNEQAIDTQVMFFSGKTLVTKGTSYAALEDVRFHQTFRIQQHDDS